MKINSAEFIVSVADPFKLPKNNMPEIAVVGKSNVGKSTLINLIVNNKKLAKTSQTPGRTRLINYFLINKEFYLVDLPGYGFAKAPIDDIKKWKKLIESYLIDNKNLKNVLLLLDIRREPSENDIQMLSFLTQCNIPFTCIVTKCDKLSREAVKKNILKISSSMRVGVDNIIATSAQNKFGTKDLLGRLEQILEI